MKSFTRITQDQPSLVARYTRYNGGKKNNEDVQA